jgi:type II secretory pathway component GspD/PulD (secretin)
VPTASSSGFAYRFDIVETTTNANVVMKLGDTLVLSGLTERDSSTTRDGVPGLQDLPIIQYLFSSKQVTQIQNSALILITPRGPLYAAQGERSDSESDSVKELRERLGFPKSLPANVEAIVNGLNDNELFRQFRQGDVSMERWERVNTTGERLRQALSFLYY